MFSSPVSVAKWTCVPGMPAVDARVRSTRPGPKREDRHDSTVRRRRARREVAQRDITFDQFCSEFLHAAARVVRAEILFNPNDIDDKEDDDGDSGFALTLFPSVCAIWLVCCRC